MTCWYRYFIFKIINQKKHIIPGRASTLPVIKVKEWAELLGFGGSSKRNIHPGHEVYGGVDSSILANTQHYFWDVNKEWKLVSYILERKQVNTMGDMMGGEVVSTQV